MAIAVKYDVLFYGGTDGYGLGQRASIRVYDEAMNLLAVIKFYDSGRAIPADHEERFPPHQRMHLPSHMFASVLDVLRNEGPIHCYVGRGRTITFLGTQAQGEEVGEGER